MFIFFLSLKLADRILGSTYREESKSTVHLDAQIFGDDGHGLLRPVPSVAVLAREWAVIVGGVDCIRRPKAISRVSSKD